MNGRSPPVGIIAGSGSLPSEVAKAIVGRGGSVHIIMVDGAADPALAAFPHTIVNWAALGRATAALKRVGVRDILVLGGFARPSFRTARPDLAFFRSLPAIVRLLKAGGDDALLRGLLALFEAQGFTVAGVRELAPELLVGEGVLTKAAPSSAEIENTKTGFSLIGALGHYDIGQAAIVSGGRIEAIEAAEGTDAMLKRVAAIRQSSGERGGVLVKRPKPGQELRADLPAIGPDTVKNAAAAGLAGIAVMSGYVLAAERSDMIRLADEHELFVAGVSLPASAPKTFVFEATSITMRGSVRASERVVAEIDRAKGILSALSAFKTGSAVVIINGRVIAMGTNEAPQDMISRAGALRQNRKRPAGVAVVGEAYGLDPVIVEAAGKANLAGIASTGYGARDELPAGVVTLADRLGLFVAAPLERGHA
jgi:DUF1009 family protein